MTDKTLKDGDGNSFVAALNLVLGRVSAALSRSWTMCTEDKAVFDSLASKLDTLNTAVASTAPALIAQADEYETVAASQTDQVLGATGATGDRIAGFLINPATTSPGTVS
jgi:hypothetical protein